MEALWVLGHTQFVGLSGWMKTDNTALHATVNTHSGSQGKAYKKACQIKMCISRLTTTEFSDVQQWPRFVDSTKKI